MGNAQRNVADAHRGGELTCAAVQRNRGLAGAVARDFHVHPADALAPAGAELARSALKVASYNVKINLASVTDAAFVKDARSRMDEMLYMGMSAAQVIESVVEDSWKA